MVSFEALLILAIALGFTIGLVVRDMSTRRALIEKLRASRADLRAEAEKLAETHNELVKGFQQLEDRINSISMNLTGNQGVRRFGQKESSTNKT